MFPQNPAEFIKGALRAKTPCMYNRPHLLGYPLEFRFQIWSETMADLGKERVSGKILALFLIGGSLGAIVMSWVAYSAMIGQAL
jgi:hypothetical protein